MRRARVALWLALSPCASGCAGAPFEGGYATREASLPDAKTFATFLPGACEDAAHADRSPDFSSVELVETQTGRPLLLEHREGYALLVAENYFDEGPFWVFEVLVKNEAVLRKWRIPRSKVEVGSLAVGRALTLDAHGDRFEAGLASTRLSCSLVPKASDLPASSTNLTP
jgi:hypothetical protein